MDTTYSKIRSFFNEKKVGGIPEMVDRLFNSNWISASANVSRLFAFLSILLLFLLQPSNYIFGQTTVVTTFNTTGLSTWTVPAGVTSVSVQAWGGGGGGGGGKGGLLGGPVGGGGGGGAYSIATVAVTPGLVYNIGVGGGGGGGTSNNNGTAGNSSYFSSPGTTGTQLVVAVGGSFGVGGGAGGAGGSSGSGTGTTKYSGGTGGGGGGGSSGGTAANGSNGSGSTGGSVAGGGSGGNNNNSGSSPGGGGGGGNGGGLLSSGGSAGGNGAVGQVTITYLIPPTLVVGTNAAVIAANICPSTTTVPIHSFSITGANNPGNITAISITTAGTYLLTDIANMKLWTTTTSSFTSPTQLGATIASPGAAGVKTFNGFSQAVGNTTIYFWVTTDVTATATSIPPVPNRTLSVSSTAAAKITATPAPSGSSAASGTQTLGIGATPAAPVATAATDVACTSFTANWNASAATSGYFLDVSTSNAFGSFVAGYNNLSVGNVLTYNVSGLTAGTTYYYRVRADKCGSTSANSGIITVVTSAVPADPAVPTAVAACNPANYTLTQNTTGLVAPNALYWQETNSTGTSTALPATSTYNVTTTGTYYIRSKTTGGCWSANATGVALTVGTVTGGTIGSNQSICGSTAPLQLTSTVDGTGTGLTYSWQYDATSAFSAPTTVAVNSNVYTPPVLAATRYYRRVSTVGSCSDYSNSVEITVAPAPTIVASADVTICSGHSTNLSASGSNTGVYSWANSTGLSNVNISNPVANPTTTTTYTVTGWGTSTEKVINGNFNTATGSVGFTSDYSFWPMATTGDMSESKYFIGTEGWKLHATTTTGPGVHEAFSKTPGHGGSGNQLVVNGAGNPGANVWCETFSVAPNSDYAFSTWVSTQNVGDGTLNAAAKLQFSINDIAFGSPFYAPLTVGPWNQFFLNWNSGTSTSAKICVVNQNTTAFGNDFALDDMSFAPYCSSTDVVTVTVPWPVLSSTKTPDAVCSGSAFTYTPSSDYANPTFAWTRATVAGISNGAASGTGSINETLVNTTTAPINVTYTYHTTSQTCTGVAESVVVTVNPKPTLSSALTATICSGATLSYQPTSAVSGATFAWSRATVANINETGTSGAGDISETLTNTSGVTVPVTYVITPTANSCAGTSKNVVVSVLGSTQLSSTLMPAAICSGATFTYTATSATSGATFAWSRAAVVGISQALNSGTGNVSETLTNTTASAISVTYAYKTSANGCSNIQNVVVSVSPGPQLNSTLTGNICSGSTYAYTATSATSPATFAWTRAGVAGINGGVAGSGSGNISEVLTNSTTDALNVTYVYTTTSNSCSGATQNLVVTVNPIPTLNSSLTPASICSGTTFTYTATSATSGATFSWSRAAVAGITQAATAGTLPVSEVLDNTTTSVIPVVYSYITTANGCTGSAQNVTVGVKPLPSLSSTLSPAAICSGATFTYTATSATTGATFAWSRATVTGITEAGNSGATNPVSQVLTNTTLSPISVTYVYTTSFLSCSGSTQNVVVSVYPAPQGIFYGNTVCNSGGDIAQLTFSSTAGTGPFDLAYDDPTATPRTQNGAVSNTPFDANPNQSVVGSYVYTLTSVTDANGCVRTSAITTSTATVIVTNAQIVADPSTPASTTSCAGTVASFYVNATGVQTYGWEVNTTGANGGTYDATGPWTTVTGSETAPTYNGITSATLVVTNATTAHDGYRYRAAMQAACGPTVYSSIAKLSINILPVLTSSLAPSPATCSGQPVNYTPSSGTVDVAFSWTRAAVTGISDAAASGTGAISEVLTNTTVNPINVTYVYTITNTVTACNTPIENVVVTINPSPVLSSTTGTVASMCSPATFTYTPNSQSIGATFAWTRAMIAGISEAGTSGTGSINETLTNTTTDPINVTYVYTTTAYTCAGSPQNVVVTVNPAPVLSSVNTAPAICTALNNFSYTATSATAGTSFAWTRATVAGISEAGTSGTGSLIAETLTNTSTTFQTVTYVLTLTAGGCAGNLTQNVDVVVKPVPLLSSVLTQSVCSTQPFVYSPLSATTPNSFAWTRATVAGITPVGTSGTEGINETLTNSTASSIDVAYTYTVTSNSCSGPAQNLIVTVNPMPTFTSATTASTCSETAVTFQYTPTSNVAGTTYGWTRSTLVGITQAGTSGTGVVNEVLTNTTSAPIDVTYVYTPTASGCTTAATNVVVTVNPRPSLSSGGAANLCSGSALNYTASSATTGSTYAWTRAAVTGITEAASSGTANPLTETLTNTTTSSIDVQYIYITTANGCGTTPPDTVIITIYPTPNMTSGTTATICTGTSLATNGTLTFTSDIASDYAWMRANTASITPACPTCAGSSNPIDEVLINATAAAISTTYVVTPTSTDNNCAGTPQNVVVTVTPLPAQPNAINANPN